MSKDMKKKTSSTSIHASQPLVDVHQVEHLNPQPNPQVHTIEQVGVSEAPDSLILENHDEFYRVQEISINYMGCKKFS
jgi:hypothetical protein